MLDQIFGENNFQSEIIWKRTTAKSLAFKGFPNNHDTIFYYSGGKDFTWNRPFLDTTSTTWMKRRLPNTVTQTQRTDTHSATLRIQIQTVQT